MTFLSIVSACLACRLRPCFTLPAMLLIVSVSSVAAAPLPAPPQLSANSYLLFDHTSGEVLASKDPDKRIEPASLTKMMTAYIVASELRRGSVTLDEPVIISAEAQAMPGSRMFIEANTVVPLGELMRGLIIQSGNDASVALAEHIAASEAGFVDMMNRTAVTLGMNATNFTNASGLPDPDHYTTAHDLGLIASAIIREHPATYKLYSERDYTYNEITQKNRNTLLWRDDSVDGMKTGHTEAAGYCLVASAVRDGMRLVSVVLGTGSDKSRIAESQRLLNYGFRFFRTRKVYSAGEQIAEARIWMGTQETVGVGVSEDLYLTLPRDAFDTLQTRVEMGEYLRAPMRIGQEVGRNVLMADDEVISEVPLLALQKVEEGSIFLRMKHSIQRYLQ
ncbi:MAG: D-alanyl-D-alanine carboxypeptidase [Granulosicoccus sp.]|nr:D-alanyl-D-alanine carboxypeptidase [Granulosicoccus sp.]